MSHTLTINFTAASPAPANGYLVTYWPTGSPSSTTTTVVTSSPAVITGLTGTDYTGTIQSQCGSGQVSSTQNFTATTSSCLSGTTTATANCSSGQTHAFTIASGYTAVITPSGYYYSGSGTRAYTASITNSADSSILYTFTYTQTGSTQGTWNTTLANNTLSAGSYNLHLNQVDCSSSSGNFSLSVGSCAPVSGGGGGGSTPVLTCFTFSDSLDHYEDSTTCPGTSDTYNKTTVTLKDQFGNPFVATTNVVVHLNYTYEEHIDYPGDTTTTGDSTITVYAGHSTGSILYASYRNERGNYDSNCSGYYMRTTINGTGSGNTLSWCNG